ncbi:MAG: hypothetical protein DRI94_01315, partial [Bacteroidetes bacterium]
MEIQNLVDYIDAPYNMQSEDFENIKSLIEIYPFFHTANLLYVKAAHNINTEDYENLIAKISSSVPNRELLFKLINLSAPEVKVKEKSTDKKEESDTRKEIRERIQNRRLKRMVQKGGTLSHHGSSIHKKIVKNFFEPLTEELRKNKLNIGMMPEEIAELFPQTEEKPSETASERKETEREEKRLEREKRMEAKLKRRIEEQEKMSEGDLDKEKAEREKRRLERENRMEKRRLAREQEM